jgi:hypothetical protein
MIKAWPFELCEDFGSAVREEYSLDPSKCPAHIDFTNPAGAVTHGVYRFKDGKLEICYDARHGWPRPTDIDVSLPEKGEAATMLIILRWKCKVQDWN